MYGLKDSLLEEIRALARKHQVESVVLFGSRARGDYSERSDIDLAVRGGDFDRFALDVDEDTSTLLMYDMVSLDRPVQESLLRSIHEWGRLIYEKV